MKILVGSVSNKGAEIFLPHLKTIQWQDADVEITYVVISDGLSGVVRQSIEDAGGLVLDASPKPGGATYSVGPDTHHWATETFDWLGGEKDRLIKLAAKDGYDGLFLVDSDLLLGPETLRSLISAEKPVVSAVFWTRWQPEMPPLPQVWLKHPYEFEGLGMTAPEFFEALENRELVEVMGLGACTLIRSEAFPLVAFTPRVTGSPPGGMSDGEDRHFCIRARRAFVPLYADAWPDIYHVYRDEDIPKIPAAMAKLESPRSYIINPYTEVSFTLEPLDEPRLPTHKEYVRGRMGNLRLAPELEEALLTSKPGDERFVSVSFPPWYPLVEYHGQTRLIRMKLIDVKQRDSLVLPL